MLTTEETSRPIRLIVIDGQSQQLTPLLRELEALAGRIVVVGHFLDSERALRELETCAPDVVLVHSETAPMDALACTQCIDKSASVAVILVGTIPDHAKALYPGVKEFLTGCVTPHQLQRAIQSAAGALEGFSKGHSKSLTKANAHGAIASAHHLNLREVEVMRHVSNCLQDKEIADHMGISEALAKKILRTIFRKLGTRTRTGAALVWNGE